MLASMSSVAEPPPKSSLQSVSRIASVLYALERNRSGLSLSQLRAEVGLPISTVHRLVAALESEGFVSQSHNQIRLGATLARLGAASRGALRDEIYPYMQRLSLALQETVDLAILDEREMRFIEQIAAPRRLRAVSAVGETFPLHCTANGKALLASLPREEAAELLPRRLQRFTDTTIVSRKDLWEELDRIVADGVAYDREEHTEGICAVGAVIHDSFGAAAALSIPLPSQRFYGREQDLADELRRMIAEASAALSPS